MILGGGKGDAITRFLATAPRTNGGVQTMSPQKRSSQKQQVSQKGSPQKQSALTNFFQPVGKKRQVQLSGDIHTIPHSGLSILS